MENIDIFMWTDEMIEGFVEEENNDCKKCDLVRNSTRCLFMDNCPNNKQKNIFENSPMEVELKLIEKCRV